MPELRVRPRATNSLTNRDCSTSPAEPRFGLRQLGQAEILTLLEVASHGKDR